MLYFMTHHHEVCYGVVMFISIALALVFMSVLLEGAQAAALQLLLLVLLLHVSSFSYLFWDG